MKQCIRLRSVLFTVSALALFGILGDPSHADKLKPVLITVSGTIEGSGTDAASMALTFSGLNNQVDGSYVANPDFSLSVNGTGRTGLTLSYYFCNNPSHRDSVTLCSIAAHDPVNYRRLLIKDGALASKGQPVIVVFPAKSSWEIWRKSLPGDPSEGVLEASGQLAQPVTYRETSVR